MDISYHLLTALLLMLATFIICYLKQTFNYWKNLGLYHLKPTIPFGNAYNVFTRNCTIGELFAQWYLELKEKRVKHGGAYFVTTPVYMPVDAEIIKKILISDFEYFPNRGLYIHEKVDPLSGNLLTAEGAYWKSVRSKIPAIFTSSKVKKMFEIIEKMHGKFIENLDKYAMDGSPVNIKQETIRLTTDEILATMIGVESHCLQNEQAEIISHGKSFFATQLNANTTSIVLTIPRTILHKLNFKITAKKVENYFKDLCQSVLDYRLKSGLKVGDLAEVLIRISRTDLQDRDVTGKTTMQPLTFEQVVGTICGFYAAGYETTSTTITFAMYELAKNPDCQVRLRNEIERVLARYDGKATYESLMEMKYLEHVVDETLRLYPVLPLLPRVCIRDYKVPGTDFTIKKDTLVMVTNLGLQRDPEYYPDPNQFDPERFSLENKSTRPSVAYLPFGDGERICVGKRLGLIQVKLGILALVRNYEITLNEKTLRTFNFEPYELLLRKKGDVWLNLRKLNITNTS